MHLAVVEAAWDETWNSRLSVIERIAPILASLDIAGAFGVGCFDDRAGESSTSSSSAKAGWPRGRASRLSVFGVPLKSTNASNSATTWATLRIKRMLEFNLMGLMQGATWPVRILARGQINTFLFNEILLVETAIVPLMLLEKDRRAFHRNMFTRAKLLPPEQREHCARLVERIETSVRNADRAAMRDVHIEIFREICRLGSAAFARYGLEFPPRAENEMIDFYKREWPT